MCSASTSALHTTAGTRMGATPTSPGEKVCGLRCDLHPGHAPPFAREGEVAPFVPTPNNKNPGCWSHCPPTMQSP